MTEFLYALKYKESKRQYPASSKCFLIIYPITQQATNLLLNAKHNPQWIEETFMDFVGFQLEMVSRGEIAEPTIRNYYKATLVNWKMITRGLPRGKEAANDRAPTMEEIHILVQYLDRRIKAIVATMVSSGFRIGA